MKAIDAFCGHRPETAVRDDAGEVSHCLCGCGRRRIPAAVGQAYMDRVGREMAEEARAEAPGQRDPSLAPGLRFAARDAAASAEAARREEERAKAVDLIDAMVHARVAEALERRAAHYHALADHHDG